ncbi:BR serine/threonine-protein kinase [Penicillium robsamsonii]|uniref:BR serine/threonine-protein kinase n=1 Tax=Penicillium robsamsonii TaxID=1792511 RepID=UPI002549009B|nr:BR serine/threonine-protein kinase [Penicillium robsamsonii]KAJ5807593.1 BR serine/threonine-protein kinase [Penicillium robsamsonii]
MNLPVPTPNLAGNVVRKVRRRKHSDPNERIPPGVEEVISRGSCHIGKLNDTMVLKYASDFNDPGYLTSVKVENRILTILGAHPRIAESKGLAEDGLILKYYPNGTLRTYIKNHPHETLERRLEWCKQLVDTLSYVHSKSVIHCDICLHNILLDENYDIILTDFQGLLISITTGRTLLDGLTRECAKSYMPRENVYFASVRTDLFAVGSAIYHLIAGHEVFPELDSFDDEKVINARFVSGEFPKNDYVASHIVERCWRGEYESAAEISVDIAQVQATTKAVEEDLNNEEALKQEEEYGDEYGDEDAEYEEW